MSDNPHRRHGTDYDTLRGLGGSRSPREGDDPLAELARLVGQGGGARAEPSLDPRQRAASETRRTPAAPEPRLPPFGSPQQFRPASAPAASRVSDRLSLSPLGDEDDHVPVQGQRAYGAPAVADYEPDDFFADDPAPRHAYAASRDSRDGDDDFAPRATFDPDFDEPSMYPGEHDHGGYDLPVRRRNLPVIAASVAALLVVGSLGAWALGAFGGGDGASDGAPPLIRAAEEPMKTVAEAPPAEPSNKISDRVPEGSVTVVPSAEEPGERPIPRQILPGAGTGDAEGGPAAAETAEGAAPADGDSAPRVVKTMTIRPDGSAAPAESSPSAQPPAGTQTAAAEPPPPIEGTGSAEGMSMQPGSDFGIMAPETATAPQPAGGPVPLPMPRPQVAQAPAVAPVAPTLEAPPASAAPPPRASAPSGPPSSPQPDVKVTNRRTLTPQGPIPPARAVPAQPRAQAAPAANRQVAMAAPQPTAPQALAPTPTATAAPQVAITGSTGASASGSFGVQLTAQRSEAEAVAAFNALKSRYPQVLGSYQPTVARADLGPNRGVFYRALVAAPSQSEAANLCVQFKASGVDCIVQRR